MLVYLWIWRSTESGIDCANATLVSARSLWNTLQSSYTILAHCIGSFCLLQDIRDWGNTQNITNYGNTQDITNTQDIRDWGNTQNITNYGNTKDITNIQDIRDWGNTQHITNYGNTQDITNIQDIRDWGNTQNITNYGNTQDITARTLLSPCHNNQDITNYGNTQDIIYCGNYHDITNQLWWQCDTQDKHWLWWQRHRHRHSTMRHPVRTVLIVVTATLNYEASIQHITDCGNSNT